MLVARRAVIRTAVSHPPPLEDPCAGHSRRGRRRGAGRCGGRPRVRTGLVALEGLRLRAEGRALRRPDAHDHAVDPGLGGLRPLDVHADDRTPRPGSRTRTRPTASRRRATLLQTDQLGTQLDPPAHWAPEYAAIDELPPTFAVRPLVVISIVPQVAQGLQLLAAGLRHPRVGDAARPDPGGQRRHGALGLVEALARSRRSRRSTEFPGVSLDALEVPAPPAAHPLPRPRAAGHRLDADARGRVLAHAQRLRAGRGRRQPRQGAGHGLPGRRSATRSSAAALGGYARFIAICPPSWRYGVSVGELPEAPMRKYASPLHWDAQNTCACDRRPAGWPDLGWGRCASASPPARRDSCTSAARAPRSTTGSWRAAGRHAGPAHRGHRPRALDARERRADPRRAALARARLGRGADLAGRALRRHEEVLQRLLDAGHAYRSTATADDVKACKAEHGADRGFRGEAEAEGAVRLRVPDEGETVVHDLIRGDTTFQHVHLDDPVIARADGTVLYNFAVAVDDLDAGITHVVRGEDHLSNTPKQLLVLEALGRRAAGLRPPAAAARPRRQEALQAPRRGLGPGAARRRLPARGGAQLPRAARLGRRRRRDVLHDRRARSSGSASSACRATRPQFDEQKLRWMNGRYMRELGTDELTAAPGGAHRPHRPARRGRHLARRRSRPWRTSGRWPASSSTARPTTRGAREVARRRRARRRWPTPATRSRGWSRSTPSTSSRRCAGWSRTRGAKPKDVFQPVRVALAGTTGLSGHLRDPRGARPRRGAARASTPRCGPEKLPEIKPDRARLNHPSTRCR